MSDSLVTSIVIWLGEVGLSSRSFDSHDEAVVFAVSVGGVVVQPADDGWVVLADVFGDGDYTFVCGGSF